MPLKEGSDTCRGLSKAQPSAPAIRGSPLAEPHDFQLDGDGSRNGLDCTSMRPLLLLLAAAATTLAHPGSGIVVDRSGQIYFVLSGPAERIMRIDTRGNLSAFVTDERVRGAHHLVIDELGNLYTVSESESVVWQIKPDGQILRAYPHLTRRRASRIGAWGDPFTLDRDGNIYCIGYPERTRILRISPRGVMTSFAGGVSSGHADGPGAKARLATCMVLLWLGGLTRDPT